MRALIAALLLAIAGPSLAAEIVVTNGDTLQLDRTIYRLEGIDAPETSGADQFHPTTLPVRSFAISSAS